MVKKISFGFRETRNYASGIVNLGNLFSVSPLRTTANLLICGPDVGRARLKKVEIRLNLTMPDLALPWAIRVTRDGKHSRGGHKRRRLGV